MAPHSSANVLLLAVADTAYVLSSPVDKFRRVLHGQSTVGVELGGALLWRYYHTGMVGKCAQVPHIGKREFLADYFKGLAVDDGSTNEKD